MLYYSLVFHLCKILPTKILLLKWDTKNNFENNLLFWRFGTLFGQSVFCQIILLHFSRWGIKTMSILESQALGVQWSNLFTKSDPANPLTMGAIWGMFIADMVIYSFITWYIDAVKPGKYGVARKWYFLFQVRKQSLIQAS